MTRRRRPIHLAAAETLGRPVIVLLTVCVASRRPILANAGVVAILTSAWRAADGWAVGRYVVMPDHVHLFGAPRRDVSLGRWAHYWKALSARHMPAHHARPLWQRDYWDTQLRSAERYEEKWEYVRANPVRHGLVDDARHWPFAGEMTRLDWD